MSRLGSNQDSCVVCTENGNTNNLQFQLQFVSGVRGDHGKIGLTEKIDFGYTKDVERAYRVS